MSKMREGPQRPDYPESRRNTVCQCHESLARPSDPPTNCHEILPIPQIRPRGCTIARTVTQLQAARQLEAAHQVRVRRVRQAVPVPLLQVSLPPKDPRVDPHTDRSQRLRAPLRGHSDGQDPSLQRTVVASLFALHPV